MHGFFMLTEGARIEVWEILLWNMYYKIFP